MVRNERGVLSIPLGLLFLCLAVAAFGILGVLRNWRGKMAIQLEIDRCVGLAAQNLNHSLERLGELNRAMIATRVSLATVGNIPQVRAPLEAALATETTAQELVRAHWDITMAAWLAKRGCRASGGDAPKPLPGLGLVRPLPDTLGTKPLEWEPGVSHVYTVWLAHPPRYSAATISPKENGDTDDDEDSQLPTSWQAVWSDPFRRTGRVFSP